MSKAVRNGRDFNFQNEVEKSSKYQVSWASLVYLVRNQMETIFWGFSMNFQDEKKCFACDWKTDFQWDEKENDFYEGEMWLYVTKIHTLSHTDKCEKVKWCGKKIGK